jgi:hypothetical protein
VRRVPAVGQLRTGGCRGHAERASGRWSRAPALPVGPATRPRLPPPPAARPVGSGVVRAGEPDPAEGPPGRARGRPWPVLSGAGSLACRTTPSVVANPRGSTASGRWQGRRWPLPSHHDDGGHP